MSDIPNWINLILTSIQHSKVTSNSDCNRHRQEGLSSNRHEHSSVGEHFLCVVPQSGTLPVARCPHHWLHNWFRWSLKSYFAKLLILPLNKCGFIYHLISPADIVINQSINHEVLERPKYIKHCQVHYRQCVDTKYQIRRMSVYDSVNRNASSHVWKVARDGVNVTSGGRQFQTQSQQPKILGRQQWSVEPEAERGSRCMKSEPSATWKVGNVSEWAKVRRCTVMHDCSAYLWTKH